MPLICRKRVVYKRYSRTPGAKQISEISVSLHTLPTPSAPIRRLIALICLVLLAPLLGSGPAPAQLAGGDPGVRVPGFWDPRRRPEKPDLSRVNVIRFLTETDYPPFNFAGPDGNPQGFNVDLARIQSSLIATHLSGTIAAEVAQQKQIVRADLRQADLALAFAATIVGHRIEVERLRAHAAGGEIAGSGNFDLDGKRPFSFTARATRFNPARFVDMPAAQLDGTVTARGTLTPTWDVTGDVAVAAGSRFAGLAVAGTARAHATPSTAKDVAVDLHFGAASIKLTGAFGTANDTLAYAIEIPRLQEFRPLFTRYAKATLPEPVAGALRARGTVTGEPRSLGFAVNAHGDALQWGPAVRVATLDVTASAAPGASREGRVALEARPITITVAATGVTALGAALLAAQQPTVLQFTISIATLSSSFPLLFFGFLKREARRSLDSPGFAGNSAR